MNPSQPPINYDHVEETLYKQLAILWLEACFPDIPCCGDPRDPLTLAHVGTIADALLEKRGNADDVVKDLAEAIAFSILDTIQEGAQS